MWVFSQTRNPNRQGLSLPQKGAFIWHFSGLKSGLEGGKDPESHKGHWLEVGNSLCKAVQWQGRDSGFLWPHGH